MSYRVSGLLVAMLLAISAVTGGDVVVTSTGAVAGVMCLCTASIIDEIRGKK